MQHRIAKTIGYTILVADLKLLLHKLKREEDKSRRVREVNGYSDLSLSHNAKPLLFL